MSDNLETASNLRSVDWGDDALVIIDQTLLPGEVSYLRLTTVDQVVRAIKSLAVRGAPSIGVAGGFGVILAFREFSTEKAQFVSAVESLRRVRPTAVNLARSVDRVARRAEEGMEAMLAEATAIRDEEIAACWSMGINGAELLVELLGNRPQRLMTICNTGGLAAVERGTALGVIQTMFERGLLEEALAVETRPLLQGSRLTTWELARMGAPFRLLVDSAGPFVLARGGAEAVLTGADRIAANGDTANKVGSLALALGARHAGAPFIVVAPESTIDEDTPTGDMIEIEDRGAAEVIAAAGIQLAPETTQALNPAFDVTPVELITAIVTDRRIVRVDRGEKLADVPLGERRLRAEQ
ncbi:MAG: S-methyl-5-thioribose-1-phosphate isomerase [Acidimicrobiia bacterium]